MARQKDKAAEGSNFSRRDFFKRGAVAGIGAGAVATAGIGSAYAQSAGDDQVWDEEVDILIAGAGNGGMSAAIAAAEGGAKTLLLEISTQIGGNTLMSGGIMHTSMQRTWEDYNRYTDGAHDQVLGKIYIETFWNEYIPWLQSHNAYMSRPNPDGVGYGSDWVLGKGEPGQLRHKLYFDSLVAAYEGLGGTIRRQTRTTKLITDAEGKVIGVQARTWNTSPREPLEDQPITNIKAKKVILAIGGWIMDGERKQRYLGPDGFMAHHYCGPFSSGEGMDMAQAVGAALSQSGWPTFSGTVCAVTAAPQISADPDRMLRMWKELPPEDWTTVYSNGRPPPPAWVNIHIQFGGLPSRGILVNKLGERFVDEGSINHSKYPRVPVQIIRQPGGYAWMIGDQDTHDAIPGSDAAIQRIIDEGGVLGTHGNVIIADTIEEFAEALSRAGVYKHAFLKMIEEYNAAVDAGTQDQLKIPHSSDHGSGGHAIRKGPFYAIPVTTDPYIMHGGLRINGDAQVLDAQGAPIPNLYAPPPLGGGIQNGVYTGAIASAGTFGYLAGKHAAAAVASATA